MSVRQLNRKLAFCVLAALAFPIALLRAQAPLDSLTLQPGDMVRIAVWRHPDFSGEFPIDASGAISHPIFRSIHVIGLPLSVVEGKLQTVLKEYDAQPAFTFAPLLRIFVLGEVRAPNTLTVPPGTTLPQAVALAGGPTPDADMRHVRLVRDGQATVLDLTQPDPAITKLIIRSGDELVIGRGTNFLRDYLGPMASLVSVAVGVANLVRHR